MHDSKYLLDIITLLSAAIVIVVLFWKLNISPVLGYFVAGTLIGSNGLNLVESSVIIQNLGEFGVVFLLFLIGIELTFERLIAMRLHVFGFGTLQVIVTALAIWYISSQFGVDSKGSIIIGGALALSSTAIVLQVLQEKGYQSTQVGRLSIAVLLLQDFAVVPLIVLLPLLTGESHHSIPISLLYSFVKAAIALTLIFITGRLLLRPLFNTIAAMKSNEIFIATTLLIVLGAAFITENFNLSMALGAFVSGLLVAETEYRHDVEQVVLPFKRLLLGLFFMTVGMSIDIKFVLNKLPIITLASISLIALKSFIIFILCRFFRFQLAAAIQAGLLLSQGGEFAFILFGLAAEKNVLSSDLAQTLMMITTVTMAFTPLLATLGDWISKLITKKKISLNSQELILDTKDLDQHVIVVGFGRVGRMVAKVLVAEHVNYIASDIQPKIVKDGIDEGFPVYLGDLTKLNTLQSMAISRARMIIIAINNEVTIKKIISLVAKNFPHIIIIVRLPDLSNVEIYKELGAHYLIPETYEVGLQLGAVALSNNGFSNHAISLLKDRFRMVNYDAVKNKEDE
ncbi:sodium/hydrogen exchanger family protein [Ehrlichia chaffeensis str. Liberty]|uniref:Glutathione-regulated potassium-efflux system protein KefB n=1 Tax=Ehrlichia chaffeensis (strain ATCC CRL-10679 / Arkansas) TaxID=205920 RepID=Q2GHV9_EHRCR|nr:cation:proton antiporter [Ehrlichia chaffeensis]ABD44790.1 putative glutathione-regulated potassium-efflux system protein KefB [Ehrlichia chaffeensis str. Arkansas]AHX05989.1 sodium/hydrogen exchanger family protein [Ehrlichia chaffeensis str. Jax]AHX06979.1 sodium/hydrogen exchanger family protein [Ehrlichia chaffeensis str. Liberty]AHX07078.1 sodium/hydrogen exchanger family protein [Ehrlichia chaffeensis str. Osceola]AHX08364.1 sodium/hydrogen exchanger family protein [Ehrlichia chaffeen